jgi:hypothetical protein
MPVISDQNIANAAAVFWPDENDIAIAVAVALAESGGDTTKVSRPNTNGTIDRGLWQVNSVHGFPPDKLLAGAVDNAGYAHQVWAGRGKGWREWSSYNSGAYLLYLARGKAVAGTVSRTSTPTGPGIGDSKTDPETEKQNVFTAIGDGVTAIVHAGEWFTDPHNWLRVLYVIAGGALIIGGLVVVASTSKAGKLIGAS